MTDFNDPLETDPYPNDPFVVPEADRVRAQVRQARQRARTAIDVDEPQGLAAVHKWAMMSPPPQKPEGETEWADTGKSFVSGAGGLAASAAGAGEYLANYFAGGRQTPSQQGAGSVADWFTGARHSAEAFSQDWFKSMTPEAQARSQRDILSLDPDKTIWQGGVREVLSSMALKMSQSAPSALVTLLPGAILMRVGLAGGVTYLGASEGALSMGSIAANIANEVEQAPEAQLMQAPRYAQLRRQMSESQARQQLIAEAQGYAPVIGGLTVGAISALAGRYFEPIITDGASGMAGRFARGYVNEGLAQEAPQSAAEQIAQNVAAQTFDASRGTFQGAGEAAAQGTVAGGPMGGLTAAALGHGPAQQQLPEADTTIPGETGPEAFGEVFGAPTAPPPGGTGWRGGDVEFSDSYDQTVSPNILGRKDKKGRMITEPEPRGAREFETSGIATGQRMMDLGPVDRDVQAALNLRRDKTKAGKPMMEDMFETPPGVADPEGPIQQSLEKAGNPYQQQGMFPTEPPPPPPPGGPGGGWRGLAAEQAALGEEPPLTQQQDVFPASLPAAPTQQAPLGLTDERGRVIQPQPTIPQAEDLTLPDSAASNPELARRAAEEDRLRRGGDTRADFLRGRQIPPLDLAAGTARDVRQEDMFTGEEPLGPDEPTAEPMGDIKAQLEELADPDNPRLGVYLSRANMARLEKIPVGVGVPLANFDGKGGVLIAKNRKVAEEVLRFRDSGAADMQEILGFVTGSGQGKPSGANIVVQQRDEEGNVVRESAVASPEEADTLASQFDQPELGRTGAVVSVSMALKRRAQRIAAEEAAGKKRETEHTARRRVSETDAASRYLPQHRAHEVAATAAILREQIAEAQAAQSDAPTRSARLKARVTEEELQAKLEKITKRVAVRVEKAAPEPLFKDRRESLEKLSDEEIANLTDEQIDELFSEAAVVGTGSRVTRSEDAAGPSFGGDTSSPYMLGKEMIERADRGGRKSPDLQRYEQVRQELADVKARLKLKRTDKDQELKAKLTAERDALYEKLNKKPKDIKTRAMSYRLAPLKKRLKETKATLEIVEQRLLARPGNVEATRRKRNLTRVAAALQHIITTAQTTGKLPKYRDEALKAAVAGETRTSLSRRQESERSDVQEAVVAEAKASSESAPSGRTYEQVLASEGASRATKIAYIMRQRRNLRIRAEGGKTKTAPITGEGKVTEEGTPARKSELSPTKAFNLEPPREMGPEKRKAHKQREKAAYSGLDKALEAYTGKVLRIRQILERNSFEREADGNPPHLARNAIYGRAYFSALYEYGQMLKKLHPRSNAGLAEVEKFTALITRLTDAKPDEILERLGKAMEAESHAQARAAINVDKGNMGGLESRTLRRKTVNKKNRQIEALNKRLAAVRITALAKQADDDLHRDVKMRTIIAPLMQKLIGYFTTDRSLGNIGGAEGFRRGLGYTPTFGEMRNLRYALRDYKQSNKPAYKLLKEWFEHFGYKFDAEGDLVLAKKASDFEYTQPAAVMQESKDEQIDEDAASAEETETEVAEKGVTPSERSDPTRRLGVARNAKQRAIEEARRRYLTPEEYRRYQMLPAERIREDIREQMHKLNADMNAATTQEERNNITNAARNVIGRYNTMMHGRWYAEPTDVEAGIFPMWLRESTYNERLRFNALSPARQAIEERALLKRMEKEWRERGKKLTGYAPPTGMRNFGPRQVDYSKMKYAPPTGMKTFTFNAEARNIRHEAGVRRAAEVASDHILENGVVDVNDVLYALAAKLPDRHVYLPLIRGLLGTDIKDVVIFYSDEIPKHLWGRYTQVVYEDGKTGGRIHLNQKLFEDMRARGEEPSSEFIQTILHEAVHAATVGAIHNNPALRAKFETLMRDARAAAREQGIDLRDPLEFQHKEYYGIRDDSVQEFVAEAFTDRNFRLLLARIKLTPKYSVWDKIVDTVRQFFNLSHTPESINVLQAVMAHQDVLFTGEFADMTRGAASMSRVNDGYARTVAGNVLDRMMLTNRTTQRMRERGLKRLLISKERGPAAILSSITMEQLRDMYQNSFAGETVNGLKKYMKAFFQRNANIAENMETPDSISKLWTSLRSKSHESAKKAVEFSKILTEASLYSVHPDRPSTAKGNEHIKSEKQLAKHADLYRRFKALGPEFEPLYNRLRTYYADTIRKESNLVVLNSLRAVLDKPGAYTEADVERLKLNTKEGLKAVFGDDLTEDQRKVITRLAAIPQSHVGPYFPLMRFGEYVVTAEVAGESRSFSSSKAASAWAQSQREEDPTLTVSSPIERANGVWVVEVKEKEVRMAESRSDAEKQRLEMVAKYGAANVDTEPQLKSQLYQREPIAASMAGLRSILSNLQGNPAAQAAIKDFYLRSLADNSFRKHEARKEHRRGVNDEMQHRTFASYAKAASYYMAQLRFGGTMAEGLREMDQFTKAVAGGDEKSDTSAIRLGEVMREIRARDDLTHDPKEISKFVRHTTEVAQLMMLLSPSYWMINMSQPYMVTLPWLAAQSSVTDATAALVTAQKLIAHPILNQMTSSLAGAKALWSKQASEDAFSVLENVLKRVKERGGKRSQEYLDMLKVLKEHSIIDLSSTTEMRDIAEGQKTGTWQKVMDASRIMSHLTEVNNRIVTALAAYDMARNKGESEADAIEFAKQAVSQTQFNYSTANSARLFSAQGKFGPMGPLIFQFMKYPQHMYALLIGNFYKAVHGGQMERKVAVRTLFGLFATHLAAAGATGAMIQPIKWAIGLAMMMFGGDDEPYTIRNMMSGATADRLIRRGTNALFGDGKMDQVAAHGLPRLAGIDLSSRMSLGTLWMMDLRGDSAEAAIGSVAASLGGPSVSIVADLIDGWRYLKSGQTKKALEAIEPKVLKDISKMTRYTSEGLTNGAGMEIKGAQDLNAWQLFAQSMGFQPSDVAEGYAQRNVIQAKRTYDMDRRQSLLQRMNIADPEERAQIVATDVSDYNKTSDDPITYSQIIKSIQRFREREQRSKLFGLDLKDREMGLLEEAEPYIDDSEDQYEYEEAE
jgi:hypothetical protein